MRHATALLIAGTLVACEDAPQTQDEDLGSYTTDTGGLTPPIELQLPEDVRSVMVHCGAYGDDTLGTAWEIRDDQGKLFYTNGYHEEHTTTQMRVGNHDDYLPVLMPVSPDHDVSPGAWSMVAWIATGGVPTTVDCGAVYATGGATDTATINLHIVLVGLDIDAASAPDDAGVQALLEGVEGIWEGAGVSLGEVSYEDFQGDTDRFAVVDISDDDSSELNALFRTADPEDDHSIVLFLVQEISNASGSTVFGLAAGPPGAATVPGTSKSGMVVGANYLAEEPAFVSMVTAHEGAHFLGLFHTSEKDGQTHDPISDTPECPASADQDGNGRVDASECAGKGGDNLMFWNPPEGTTELSRDQGDILRRNPIAR